MLIDDLKPAAHRVLPRLLQTQAAHDGDRPFIEIGEARWSFAEAAAVAAASARMLDEADVKPGDRVALMVSNRAEFLTVFFGCAWLGAVVVPINTASRGAQLQHILENCGARLMVIEEAFAECLETLDRDVLALEDIWWIGEAGLAATPTHGGGEPAPADLKPGDLAAIIYTSGTTGPSKGVCCSHAHLVWWGANTARILDLSEGERLYTTLPLFHVNALNTVYQALLTGSTVIVGRKFSASGLWPALVENRASVTYLLGAMVPILLSRPEGEYDRAHHVRLALGPGVPARFHEPFRKRFGFELIEGYGSTETNFVIASRPGEAPTGAMGHVREGFDARIVDENDDECAAGQAGELLLRADEPYAFSSGYFAMPEKTVEAWRNLWFHTGDRVVRETDGSLRFVDRMKDAIRRRGENISSYEVEQVLLALPMVAAAAVFPVPSDMAEDEVMAALVPAADAKIDAAEVIAFCKARLSYFAIPRFIDIVEALPTTENGKVRKVALRERGVTDATWDREAAGIPVR
ncbi:ATP-dependent acyl-CoA ligase [Pararhizobium mangrovi]|uniref:ATP-dependent acyl-CoA ligase n=1 Tax=Pararhizobium mangrovi TaxID=2590452 RepID=UPI001EFEFCB7|nr:ATP-dependent acyl-CoA ligase [Pararhizobium mangrovi]